MERCYIKKTEEHSMPVTAHSVLADRVYNTYKYGYRESLGIEQQISELVELISEICDSKGIDVSEFNQDHVKTG